MAIDLSVKKILNNAGLVAELAPLIDGPDAARLAKVAIAYRNILSWFGITAASCDLDGFDGCEQGKLLVSWLRGKKPDAALMRQWTGEILSAIDDIAHGNPPTP